MRINLYAQNRHVVIVDGVPLSNFANGDFLSVKVDGNAATRTQGGDGPSMNITTSQGGQITVSLLPTSPVLGAMLGLRNQQQKNPRLFKVQVVTGVEEVITASGCAFGDLPQFQTGGNEMQPRQFVIECLAVSMDASGVEAAAGGILGGLGF